MPKRKPKAKAKSAKKKKRQTDRKKSEPLDSLPSREAMEGLLADFLDPEARSERSAVKGAQTIMYEAWAEKSPRRRLALATKALLVSEDCADAYVLLAQEKAESLEEAIELYSMGVGAGERALGKETFEEDVGYFWGLQSTRPYMRARAGLAGCLWEAGKREEAIEHYRDILRLNPNDNQGIRYLLVPYLIELGRDEDAEKLLKQFKGDCMAVWKYSLALLDFRKKGDVPAARKSLQTALETNALVPAYLLGRKKIPRSMPELYGIGDENEAIICGQMSVSIWKATPGALEWLATRLRQPLQGPSPSSE
jgi:tetratricopeptide (TPR) repeat protein